MNYNLLKNIFFDHKNSVWETWFRQVLRKHLLKKIILTKLTLWKFEYRFLILNLLYNDRRLTAWHRAIIDIKFLIVKLHFDRLGCVRLIVCIELIKQIFQCLKQIFIILSDWNFWNSFFNYLNCIWQTWLCGTHFFEW